MTTTDFDATLELDEAVHAARHGAVLVERNTLGMLQLTGKTRVDLIHRMSTQDLRGMKSGEGRATVLTTDIGRIIDRVIVYTSSDTAYLLTSEGNADAIARYLLGYVFFNDDFHLRDLTAETAIFGIYGAQAAALLQAAGFAEVDLPLHHWRQLALPGVPSPVYLHRTDPVAGDGYLVMAQQADAQAVRAQLAAAGIVPIDAAAFDYLRVRSGRPRFGHELTGDYIPLEAGLWDDVSFSKGCYIGQEIIARMESRGRLAKKLFHFRAAEPVTAGATITADGKAVGTLTSAAAGPAGNFALGYVRLRDVDEQGPFAADGVGVERLGD